MSEVLVLESLKSWPDKFVPWPRWPNDGQRMSSLTGSARQLPNHRFKRSTTAHFWLYATECSSLASRRN